MHNLELTVARDLEQREQGELGGRYNADKWGAASYLNDFTGKEAGYCRWLLDNNKDLEQAIINAIACDIEDMEMA